jgi:hypothetical protein
MTEVIGMAEYIDRIAFREKIDYHYPFDKDSQKDPKYDYAKSVFLRQLAAFPAADVVERKTGKWILSEIQRQEDIENDNYQYYCSNCGNGDLHAKGMTVPYCWYCGAKMIGCDEYV